MKFSPHHCTDRVTLRVAPVAVRTITGARLAVRASETLYAASAAIFDLTWSGFRP